MSIPSRISAVCLAAWLAAAVSAELPAPVAADEPGPRSVPLKAGLFLVATPALGDPNFRETVVLLCIYEAEGTLGVVVNRPTDLLLSEALPAIPALQGKPDVLYSGGPVQPGGLVLLFRVEQAPADTRKILEGVYMGGNVDTLARIVSRPKPSEAFRAYAGYAGWAPGQLEFEMAMGSWSVLPADAASIFDKDPARLWDELSDAVKKPQVISFPPR
jgi:putative transcriptional regulator